MRFAFSTRLGHNVVEYKFYPSPWSNCLRMRTFLNRSHLLCLIALTLNGCIFFDSPSAPISESPDQADAMEMGTNPDMPSNLDMLVAADMAADTPDDGSPACGTNDELCELNTLECGTLNVFDMCGNPVMLDCGSCDANQQCNANNICECVPLPDEELCAQFAINDTCGPVAVRDNCMQPRTISCVSCAEEEECSVDGKCLPKCVPKTAAQLCAEKEAVCGEVDGPFDNGCGEMIETVACGTCEAGKTCRDNMCFCDPVSNETLCVQAGFDCGSHELTDNCGLSKTVDCGVCPDNDCEEGACKTCKPLTPERLCIQESVECGPAMGSDSCTMSSLSVEDCEQALGQACAEGEVCTNSGQCECPTPVCQPGQCGSVRNACGASIECGACMGQDEVCNAGTNICNCEPAQCPTAFECGQYTNACGNTSGSCGQCGPGEVCQSNQCICQPETDAELCANNSAECGNLSIMDRCGTMRTISCGMTCGKLEQCIDNQCECVPESNCELCKSNEDVFSCRSFNANMTGCNQKRPVTNRCGDVVKIQCCNYDPGTFGLITSCDPLASQCSMP